jgi:hypothetical protein
MHRGWMTSGARHPEPTSRIRRMCDSAAVNAGVDHGAVWKCALELRDALLAGDAAIVEAMCTSEFWERAGRDELLGFTPHVASATALGVLARHSMLRLSSPGARYPEAVVEQLWAPYDGRLLIEDERLFTLIDRAEVEASGEERLARLRTKLDAQDAALAYVAALNGHDPAAATAMWSTAHDEGPGREVPPQISSVRRAELIGSVGPRTLVWLAMDDGEATVELLWRRRDGRLLIEGARTFTPGAAA